MKILGIETSCDETSAAVVELKDPTKGTTLHSNIVASSVDLHVAYGGVVPEIAARSHIESIIPVVDQALQDARCNWNDIDAIAVTYGAGLGGSLLVGVMTARTFAIAKKKPLYAINHVEGHIYANFITEMGYGNWEVEDREKETVVGKVPQNGLAAYQLRSEVPAFPMLGLIVSGGHSQLVLWRDHFEYTLLGQTRDDAIGEAFDKVAKILGLPYPGGPSIHKKAVEGNASKYDFPKAQMTGIAPALAKLRDLGSRSWDIEDGRKQTLSPNSHFPNHSYDFSFSGPKTAVLRCCQEAIGENFAFPSYKLAERLSEAQKADIAASFQRVAIETVVDKTLAAYEEFKPKSVVIGGGVAASPELRRQLAERLPIAIEYQDASLMTDNGAMIAALGCFHHAFNRPKADPYTLAIQPNLSM